MGRALSSRSRSMSSSTARRRGGVAIVVVALVILGTGCAGDDPPVTPSPGSSRSSPSAATATSATSSPATSEVVGYRYVGPSIAVDIPSGWHEFELELSQEYFAAYGPVSGGSDDYVSVAPLPEDLGDAPGFMVLDILVPRSQRAPGSKVEPLDVNGLDGYTVAVGSRPTYLQQLTYVEGERGNYLIACQSGQHVRDLVEQGCREVASSLVEMDAPEFLEPSGCSERELALVEEIAVPPGAEPVLLEGRDDGGGHICDFEAIFRDGGNGEVVAFLDEAIRDAGWNVVSGPVVDRQMERWDVQQIVATRDFDVLMVEAYVDGDVAQNYFVTAHDG